MYNRGMMKRKRGRSSSTIFLILGFVFLIIGISTDQTAFSWIAIGLVLAYLLSGGGWLRGRRR